ncbi:MAG: PHP domain-containing protein [Spirochaetes bacterium]|nr:PHP domain-containing protein [Spirochaetota bacterium]
MNKKIDLHIHSNFSEDADFSVNKIFNLAQKSSISAISITDHDSIESIGQADTITKNYSIEYVPGVELTTVFPLDNSQQHILGYYVNSTSRDLLNCLEKIAGYRKEIEKQRIEALKKLNFSLDENKIRQMTGKRPSTAVSIMNELFTNKANLNDQRLHVYLYGDKKGRKLYHFYKDYFTKNGMAYVPFQSISSQEGIEVIKISGGIPVIAHPIMLEKKKHLDVLKEMGIMGIEAVSTYHKPKDIKYYLKYAEKNKLLVTAGSDFHGPTAKPHIMLGSQSGMDYSFYEKLKNIR